MKTARLLRIPFLFFPVALSLVIPGTDFFIFAFFSGVIGIFAEWYRHKTRFLPFPVFLILFYGMQMMSFLLTIELMSPEVEPYHSSNHRASWSSPSSHSSGNFLAKHGSIQTMSIIMAAHNEHQYMKRTLDSIYERTPSNILKEIIVIDDASTPPLANEMMDFPDVKIIRHEVRKGLIKSKTAGGNAATGDLLMFLDAHVKPEWGWVDPLFRHVNINYKRVVVPLIPILDGETWVTNNNAVGVKMMFDWSLHFNWFEDGNDLVPCMSGGLFAISKKWWHESGEYDYDMKMWGAENIEQSIRIWLCGGEIYVARDSRVAHVFRPKFPYAINMTEVYTNKVRTVETWFDEYKSYYYAADPVAHQFKPWIGDISGRLALRDELHCKNFDWYVDKFKSVFLTKHMLPEETFMIRSKASGNCLQASQNLENVEEVACDTSDKKQRWQHGNSGTSLRSFGAMKCVDANAGVPEKEGMPLFLYPCYDETPMQAWKLSEDGQIAWNGEWAKYCAVRDGAKPVLTVQRCNKQEFAAAVHDWEMFDEQVEAPKYDSAQG